MADTGSSTSAFSSWSLSECDRPVPDPTSHDLTMPPRRVRASTREKSSMSLMQHESSRDSSVAQDRTRKRRRGRPPGRLKSSQKEQPSPTDEFEESPEDLQEILFGSSSQSGIELFYDPGSSKDAMAAATLVDGVRGEVFEIYPRSGGQFIRSGVRFPGDWYGDWADDRIDVGEAAHQCNRVGGRTFDSLKRCLLEPGESGEVKDKCDALARDIEEFELGLSLEELFAIHALHQFRAVEPRLKPCARRRGLEVEHTNICRISIAIPVVSQAKEKRIRDACRKMCDSLGVKRTCFRMLDEGRAAAVAVLRQVSGDSALRLRLADEQPVIVVDMGGNTTDICTTIYRDGRFLIEGSRSLATGNGLFADAVARRLCERVSGDEEERERIRSHWRGVPPGRFHRLDSVETTPGEAMAGLSTIEVRETVMKMPREAYGLVVDAVREACDTEATRGWRGAKPNDRPMIMLVGGCAREMLWRTEFRGQLHGIGEVHDWTMYQEESAVLRGLSEGESERVASIVPRGIQIPGWGLSGSECRWRTVTLRQGEVLSDNYLKTVIEWEVEMSEGERRFPAGAEFYAPAAEVKCKVGGRWVPFLKVDVDPRDVWCQVEHKKAYRIACVFACVQGEACWGVKCIDRYGRPDSWEVEKTLLL